MGSMFGLAATLLLPVLALTGATLLTTTHGILVAGYLAVFPMGIGYLLFGRGLQGTSASTATAVSLLEPVVAALLAELVAGQQLSGPGWAGIILVGTSVTVLAVRTRHPAALQTPGEAPSVPATPTTCLTYSVTT